MKAAAVVLLGLVALASAQVASVGKFTPKGREPAGVFALPKQDNDALLAATVVDELKVGGYQFANPVKVSLTSENAGEWTVRADGSRVWKLTITSTGATTLGLTFDLYRIPQGAELYVYNEFVTRGAFTAANNKRHGWLTVTPIKGDEMTIEYIQPAGIKGKPVLSIHTVAHGFRHISKPSSTGVSKKIAFGDSGRCNINVVCPEADGWENEVRGAGMLLTQFGSRYCSGSMINNAARSGRQLFLTAYHCTGGADSYSDAIMFNYESTICDRVTQTDGPTTMTVSGLASLAHGSQSDFSLLEAEEDIPASYNVYLPGFNAVNSPAVTMFGIHHPSGDIKKWSFSNETAVPTYWSEIPNRWHWEVPHWDLGTTEPGSSGSPLFNKDHQIIGQLHGGAASCTNIDYDSYGALWASWDQQTAKLVTFLDPNGTGTRSIGGIELNAARAMNRKN